MDKEVGPPRIEPSRDGGGRRGSYAPPRRKGAGEEGARDERPGDGPGGAAGFASRGAATDVSIAGIAADKLSPETERVIETLLADIGQLRGELDVARRRLV
jgi:hypothetical protein